MRFYATDFNISLKATRDEPQKLFSILWVVECDWDGREVQYVLDDLSIKKLSVSPLLASLGDPTVGISNPASQIIINPIAPEAANVQIFSPPRDANLADPTDKAAHISLAIIRVEHDLWLHEMCL